MPSDGVSFKILLPVSYVGQTGIARTFEGYCDPSSATKRAISSEVMGNRQAFWVSQECEGVAGMAG